MKISRRGRNLLLLTASLTGSLIMGELALRLLTPFPVNTSSHKVEDARLGYRMSSALPEIDERGFRNPPSSQRVLAAIGDSHTYGYNVHSKEAWPAVLQESSGIPTYNYGSGGYGIYAYHALIKQTVAEKSPGVLIALYPPNDLAERSHCHIGRESNFWDGEIKRLSLSMPPCPETTERAEGFRIGGYIENQTAIGSAVKHLVIDKLPRVEFGASRAGDYLEIPKARESVKLGRVRRHARAMNTEREEIRMIWGDFLKMLADWAALAREENLLFGLMIIPSKERLLVEYARRNGGGELAKELMDAIRTETELEARIISEAGAVGLPAASALEALLKAKESAMQKGVPLYRPGDGHPHALGYAAYAQAAFNMLQRSCGGDRERPICSQIWARGTELDR